MFIGPWQEYALARQLQAARVAERSVSLVLRNLEEGEGAVDDFNWPPSSSPSLISLALGRAAPRPRRHQYAPPPPPPPPLPLARPPTKPWVVNAGGTSPKLQRKQKQQGQRQAQQSVPAGAGDRPPPRLRDVERMRRAYLSRIEGLKDETEKQGEDEDDQKAAEHDEGDVDALMEWVKKLESEDESDT